MTIRSSVMVSPGREVRYPAALRRLAGMGGIPLLCAEFADGAAVLVEVTVEGAEVVASGGSYLRARFELLGWPRSTVTDTEGGFAHHLVPAGDRAALDDFLALLAARPSVTLPSGHGSRR
ncbi:hypothetical protein [Kitasatospora sp. NPDC004531]